MTNAIKVLLQMTSVSLQPVPSLHDSRFVTTITTFSTKIITMKTTIQQTPPFLSKAENPVSRLPLDPYQPYAIQNLPIVHNKRPK
jgi:hypothetical protein